MLYFHSILRLGLTTNHSNGGSKATEAKEYGGLSTIKKINFEEGDGGSKATEAKEDGGLSTIKKLISR